MGREVHTITALAKHILPKERFLKLKEIKDTEERAKTTHHAIMNHLEQEFHLVEKELAIAEREAKDVFFARVKSMSLPSKLQYARIDFYEKEIREIFFLIREIRKELHVRP